MLEKAGSLATTAPTTAPTPQPLCDTTFNRIGGSTDCSLCDRVDETALLWPDFREATTCVCLEAEVNLQGWVNPSGGTLPTDEGWISTLHEDWTGEKTYIRLTKHDDCAFLTGYSNIINGEAGDDIIQVLDGKSPEWGEESVRSVSIAYGDDGNDRIEFFRNNVAPFLNARAPSVSSNRWFCLEFSTGLAQLFARHVGRARLGYPHRPRSRVHGKSLWRRRVPWWKRRIRERRSQGVQRDRYVRWKAVAGIVPVS